MALLGHPEAEVVASEGRRQPCLTQETVNVPKDVRQTRFRFNTLPCDLWL
jgi:hypothetical protein